MSPFILSGTFSPICLASVVVTSGALLKNVLFLRTPHGSSVSELTFELRRDRGTLRVRGLPPCRMPDEGPASSDSSSEVGGEYVPCSWRLLTSSAVSFVRIHPDIKLTPYTRFDLVLWVAEVPVLHPELFA